MRELSPVQRCPIKALSLTGGRLAIPRPCVHGRVRGYWAPANRTLGFLTGPCESKLRNVHTRMSGRGSAAKGVVCGLATPLVP